MFNFQFLVAFIMDLSFGLAPSHRRTSKFEQLSFLKGKSCREVPFRTRSSNNMFDNDVDCRATPFMLQGCGQRTKMDFFPKSYNEKDHSPCISKDMMSKPTSAAISFIQHTIVGGFVGSKNYAGGSFYGGRSQIWDFLGLMRDEMELMSIENSLLSKPMSNCANKTKFCNFSSQTSNSLSKDNFSRKISDEVLSLCLSSVSTPKSSNTKRVDTAPEKVINSVNSMLSEECSPSKIVMKESAGNPCSNFSSPVKEKYSSVVNGTSVSGCKSVLQESSSLESSPAHGKSVDSCMVNSPSLTKQSYAEVAKTIPPKPLVHQGIDFYTETQNYKKKLMRSKSNKCCDFGGRGRSMNNSTNLNMGDIIVGDTRWRSKARSKRPEFKSIRPTPDLSPCGSATEKESAAEDSSEVESFEVLGSASEEGWCAEIFEKEPLNVCQRRRCSSVSSVDSEDSYVVFANSPEASLSSSPYSTACVSPCLELEEDSDDESTSSGDYSSSEDDESEDNVSLGSFHAHSAVFRDEASKDIKKKMVRFAEGSALAVVRPMIAWSFAYREARRGNWEVYSRDRARFQCRISKLAPVLNSVLDSVHRKRIFESRFVER